MKIAILTNEYPPHVYGGAGVHVEYLTRELSRLEGDVRQVSVLCFGGQKEYCLNRSVEGIDPAFPFPQADPRHQKLLNTLLRNLIMAGTLKEADIIHCHTWYTAFAGFLLKNLLAIPLVLTTHSLEPQRPWKEEQLGAAYRISTWLERTAYQAADGVIAVSAAMKREVHDLYGVPEERIRVIHNGIDLRQYEPRPGPGILASYGIDPEVPFILFVGRITRQKGIGHLLEAIPHLRPGLQVVLFAGAPDTEELGREVAEKVERVRLLTPNRIIWVPRFVSKEDLIGLYSAAQIFVCPSVYEPFGIINLEAMACGTPVVGSAVGGIPEIIVHGETGLLVPFAPAGDRDPEPADPPGFARDLAQAINGLLASPETLQRMGAESRRRVEKYFSWERIARQTLEFYRELAENRATP